MSIEGGDGSSYRSYHCTRCETPIRSLALDGLCHTCASGWKPEPTRQLSVLDLGQILRVMDDAEAREERE